MSIFCSNLFIPFWHILVGNPTCNIKHDNCGLSLNIITIPKSTHLERKNFNEDSRNVCRHTSKLHSAKPEPIFIDGQPSKHSAHIIPHTNHIAPPLPTPHHASHIAPTLSYYSTWIQSTLKTHLAHIQSKSD